MKIKYMCFKLNNVVLISTIDLINYWPQLC